MAGPRDQLAMESGLTVFPPVLKSNWSCIHKTDIIWSYELRLSSTTCQNDHNERSYPSVSHFIGFVNVSEAKNGFQNGV